MINSFIIFFLLIALILAGAHWLLYYVLISLFNIETPAYQITLLAILGFLAVSFILASLLARWQENVFTRIYYLISGWWLALLVNLFLALLIYWLIKEAAILGNFNWPLMAIGATLLVLAFALTLYGTYNAFHPQVKNITVRIKNLPDYWRGKTIVQLSDVHLGNIYGPKYFSKLVGQTLALKPDLIVITGDLFDGMDGNLPDFAAPLNSLQSPNGVLYITGNHEIYLGLDKVEALFKNSPIRYLKDEVVNLNGLQIIGLKFPANGQSQRGDIKKIVTAIPNFTKGLPTILLQHVPTNIAAAEELGVNLQLSGHAHRGQLWPFEYVTKLIYGPYEYGLHQLGDYTIYTSAGIGTWGPAVRTFNTPEIVRITLE